MCKKCFEVHDQIIIHFLSLTNEKKSKNNSDDDDNLQEPHDSEDDMTPDGDNCFLRITKTVMYAAMI